MKKIATHDSATGEEGKGLLSWLVTPFARTQRLSLADQYDAGCRMFDIRVKLINSNWYCAHGCWHTKRSAYDIFRELNSFEERVHVSITYEGKGEHNEEFLDFVHRVKSYHPNIIYGAVSVKYGDGSNLLKVKYTLLEYGEEGSEGGYQGFVPLDGRDWRTYLPVPWLWNKIYTPHHEFNEETFTYVDFL